MDEDKLLKILDFVKNADQLKQVIRRNYLMDGSRLENTAEHSWHVALAALLLVDTANTNVDIDKVIKMLLMHDLVEIIAGDTPMYEVEACEEQEEREAEAAETLFGMLPQEQRDLMKALWLELETRQTPEACYAKAIDRLMPLMLNFENASKAWYPAKVSAKRLKELNEIVADGSKQLWEVGEKIISEAVAKGFVQ